MRHWSLRCNCVRKAIARILCSLDEASFKLLVEIGKSHFPICPEAPAGPNARLCSDGKDRWSVTNGPRFESLLSRTTQNLDCFSP